PPRRLARTGTLPRGDRQDRRREDPREGVHKRPAAGLTGWPEHRILRSMSRSITIDARWDPEASFWLATSPDVPGLVVEAETWPSMIEEVRLVLPDLLSLSGQSEDQLSLTFKAEEHLDVAGA